MKETMNNVEWEKKMFLCCTQRYTLSVTHFVWKSKCTFYGTREILHHKSHWHFESIRTNDALYKLFQENNWPPLSVFTTFPLSFSLWTGECNPLPLLFTHEQSNCLSFTSLFPSRLKTFNSLTHDTSSTTHINLMSSSPCRTQLCLKVESTFKLYARKGGHSSNASFLLWLFTLTLYNSQVATLNVEREWGGHKFTHSELLKWFWVSAFGCLCVWVSVWSGNHFCRHKLSLPKGARTRF